MKHAPSHFNQSSVEPFNDTIQLWVVWWSELMLNAFRFAMTLQSFRNEFTTIVILNGLDLFPLVSRHHSLEFLECCHNF
jgi:hypothetical protein